MGGREGSHFPILRGAITFSETAEVIETQACGMARPPRLERGTLCLEELTRAQFPPKY
jgi:hypothetical protein